MVGNVDRRWILRQVCVTKMSGDNQIAAIGNPMKTKWKLVLTISRLQTALLVQLLNSGNVSIKGFTGVC